MAWSRADACSLDELLQVDTPLPTRRTQAPASAVLPSASSSRADAVDLDDLLGGSAGAVLHSAPSPAPAIMGGTTSTRRIAMPMASTSESESSDDDNGDAEDESSAALEGRAIGGQLWGTSQFPAGMSQPSVWDMSNLLAAQQWQCPCSHARSDRRSCLAEGRVNVVQLFQHRHAWHARAGHDKRDALRGDLAHHYDSNTERFNHGFRVGPNADCCAPAYGLACGVSFVTFSRARADITRDRPRRAERKRLRTSRKEAAAVQVRGYIAHLKQRVEGSKGGVYVGGRTKFYTARKTDKRRYADYVAQMNLDSVEVKCTCIKDFMHMWRECAPSSHLCSPHASLNPSRAIGPREGA